MMRPVCDAAPASASPSPSRIERLPRSATSAGMSLAVVSTIKSATYAVSEGSIELVAVAMKFVLSDFARDHFRRPRAGGDPASFVIDTRKPLFGGRQSTVAVPAHLDVVFFAQTTLGPRLLGDDGAG